MPKFEGRGIAAIADKRCSLCGSSSPLIARNLGLCGRCVRERDEALQIVRLAHGSLRKGLGLPPKPPKSEGGLACGLCSNECIMAPGEKGYCGLRKNEGGVLRTLAPEGSGLFHDYLDPHVTNCCSSWFCPAGTGAGYPRFARRPGPEHGYQNLAVFFYGCNFDCLYCQNESHKNLRLENPKTIEHLVERVARNRDVTCVCYFGGSPEPQLPFAISASKAMVENFPDRVMRICFEWNGCGNPRLVEEAAELALLSGGNIKFDLKCFSEAMSFALSGVSNRRAFENFEMLARGLYRKRSELPLLTATTLLVPGYVNENEVGRIAEFISRLDRNMPYSLLVFHPDFAMQDLPNTPFGQVASCYLAAKKHLERVHVGNLNLLGFSGMGDFLSKLRSRPRS
ncbi:MAG: radical SAM protein [Candidatus Brockarchaeota archaeon]|nr:radical SAM protein [Candidatus Brockarchaeota archaeon]